MPFTVTAAQLRAIGGRGALRTEEIASAYNEQAPRFGLDVEHRAEHFLAQLAHESGGYKYFKEIWGPTTAQKRYEGRRDLGNTKRGDGSKYRGYGLIQLTGRANVTEFDRWCREHFPECPDFVSNPEKIAEMPWALTAAFWFWDDKGLNRLADADDLTAITKRINGGTNGLADRRYRYGLAVRALLSSNPSPPPAAPRDDNRPTLKKGSKGEHVVALQKALGITADGSFGKITLNAVIAFQRVNDLLPDGVVGALTWAKLDAEKAAA